MWKEDVMAKKADLLKEALSLNLDVDKSWTVEELKFAISEEKKVLEKEKAKESKKGTQKSKATPPPTPTPGPLYRAIFGISMASGKNIERGDENLKFTPKEAERFLSLGAIEPM